MRSTFLLAVALSPLVLAADPAPEPQLSPMARQFLHRRMERHGDDLTRLIRAVVLLDRPAARAIANDIASEPRLARPIPDADAELNAGLPSRFFTLQDELRHRAHALAAATTARDPAVLATAFSRLTETCVTCHAAFRSAPP